VTKDRAGGAFLEWYDYDSKSHRLFSRFHVYGVRDGGRLFKVQILSYYGEREGAPVSGLYSIRFAELSSDGAGPTREFSGIDGTAGGASGSVEEPSGCVDLGDANFLALAPEEARRSDAWHLCFRRDAVSVNGGEAGPRGVVAVDVHAGETETETIEAVSARTADTELERFDSLHTDTLRHDSLTWTADGVVSAFTGLWLDEEVEPVVPKDLIWLVVGADGVSRHLVRFDSLSPGATPGESTLGFRVKNVK
jgi:hypothetical protein